MFSMDKIQKNVLGEKLEECPIFLKSTHENTLKILPIETLKKFAIDLS